jgi:hypothetical protein
LAFAQKAPNCDSSIVFSSNRPIKHFEIIEIYSKGPKLCLNPFSASK